MSKATKSAKLQDKTAPGELGVVHAFLNTWDMIGPRERFETPARMQDWFAKRALIGPTVSVSEKQFQRVLVLRYGLRHILSTSWDGAAPDRKVIWDLNHSTELMPLALQFGHDGTPALLAAQDGFEGGVGRILAIVSNAVLDGSWQRLKVCKNLECQRTYFDRSKNRAAVWCTTQGCGNRLNARAFRARAEAWGA